MKIDYDVFIGIFKYQIMRLIMRTRLNGDILVRFSKRATIKVQKGAHIIIGHRVSLSRNTIVSATQNAHISIGTGSGVNYNTVIIAREKILIGKNVLIGPNVAIYDHNHIFDQKEIIKNSGYKTSPIIIEDNVWIGANAVILKGVNIGTGSVIAAGTVVTKDIPPNTLVSNNREICIKEINYK